MMKQILITLFCITTLLQVGYSQFNFGAGLTYLERGSDIGIQGKTFLGLSEYWGAALGADFILTNDIVFDINADAHYRFNVGQQSRIHPFGGLNLAKFPESSEIDIGINFGVFASFPIQNRLQLYLEPKVIVGGLKTFVLSAGVML